VIDIPDAFDRVPLRPWKGCDLISACTGTSTADPHWLCWMALWSNPGPRSGVAWRTHL